MSFSSFSAFQTAMLATDISVRFFKSSPGTGTVNGLMSYWTTAGSYPSGSSPGSTSAIVPTRSTTGAIQFPLASSGSFVRHLARASVFGTTTHTGSILDRLLSSDGLSGTSTSSQTVGGASVPSRGVGEVHELFLEWYTATGSTPVNAFITYTNQDGVSGRVTPSTPIPASTIAGRMIEFPLQAGDWGVQSVQSVQLDASTGSAGNFGVTVARRLLLCSGDRGSGRTFPFDALLLGLPVVPDTSCLFLTAGYSTSTSGVSFGGYLWFPQGSNP
jgi:hypothetical protein